MAFEKKVPAWGAAGIEPPESLKESGFTPGLKPPAEYFNWFMHGMSEAATELQARVDDSAPAPFIVTLSGNKDDGYTIDRTFTEITEAYNQGRVIRLIEFVPGPAIMEYSLMVAVSDQVVFANSERMYHKTINIYRNGRITRVDQTLYSDKYPPHYSDMGAEPVGAVSDHNKSADAHAGMFAPAGYGLGEVMDFSSAADIDNLYLSGNYRFFVDGGFSVAGVNLWSFYLRVDGYDENNCTQTIYCAGTSPAIIMRSKLGSWGEWEWLNPPMALGVEYRTTERCNGKTVYAVRLNLGTFGAGLHTVDTGIRAASVVRTSNMPVLFNDPTFNKNYMINVDPSVNGTLICRIVIGELNTAVGITITLWFTKD